MAGGPGGSSRANPEQWRASEGVLASMRVGDLPAVRRAVRVRVVPGVRARGEPGRRSAVQAVL